MGRRADPRQTIWEQGPNAFAFLLKEWGFEGPERTDEGIAYHRPDLHVTVERWAWKNEAGFTTKVRGVDRRTGAQHWASLGASTLPAALARSSTSRRPSAGDTRSASALPSMPVPYDVSCPI